jgi:hypothetical protein
MAAGAALVAPAITFARRPRLTLDADSGRAYSRVESDGCGYVRPLVSCARWTRGATGARVMVESYRPQEVGAGGARTTLGGTPSLGWPSAQDGTDGSLTVHPGATRPIDLGALTRGPHRAGLVYGIGGGALSGQDESWHLHLGFAGGFAITDGRDVIPPRASTIRVLVVADDAKTRRYDIDVSWNGDASDAQAALESLTLKVRSV